MYKMYCTNYLDIREYYTVFVATDIRIHSHELSIYWTTVAWQFHRKFIAHWIRCCSYSKSIGIMLQYNFLCGHSCLHAKTDLLTGKNAWNVFNSKLKKKECVNPISKPFLLFGLTTCLETSWTWVLESLHCGRPRLWLHVPPASCIVSWLLITFDNEQMYSAHLWKH